VTKANTAEGTIMKSACIRALNWNYISSRQLDMFCRQITRLQFRRRIKQVEKILLFELFLTVEVIVVGKSTFSIASG